MAKYLNGTTSQAVKATSGKLYGFIVNSHTSGTLQFNDGANGSTSAGVKATGVLTSSGVFQNNETVTIGDRTYTFKTALTGAANEVLIGANAATSLDNLKLAINAAAESGQGTLFGTGTQPHANVTATTNTDTAQTVEFWKVGTEGNSLATTETCANVAWGAATLGSGAEPNYLISNTWSAPSGSSVQRFPEAIDFRKGLYVTKGGTIDYTIIYE